MGNQIEIKFSEALEEGTLASSTIFLAKGQFKEGFDPEFQQWPVSLNTALQSVTLTPLVPLDPDSHYQIKALGEIRNAKGQILGQDFVSSFKTLDNISPHVISTEPRQDLNDYPNDAPITFILDDEIDPSSIEPDTVLLVKIDDPNGPSFPGSYSIQGSTLHFQPDAPLENNTGYAATLQPSLQDEEGNPLASPFTLSFSSTDTLPPQIASSQPPIQATDVTTAAESILVTFNERVFVNPTEEIQFFRPRTDEIIASATQYDPATLTASLLPPYHLHPREDYEMILKGTIQDFAGNALGPDLSIPFTTASFGTPAIVDAGDENPTLPALATGEDGNVYAIWGQRGTDDTFRNLYSRAYSFDGSGWKKNALRVSTDAGDVSSLQLVHHDGYLYAGWLQTKVLSNGGGTIQEYYLCEGTIDSNTKVTWGSPKRLSTGQVTAFSPSLALSDENIAIAVWAERGTSDLFVNAYASIQNGIGEGFGNAKRITDDRSSISSTQAIGGPPSEPFFVSYVQKDTWTVPIDNKENLYLRSYDGLNWSSPSQASLDIENVVAPQVRRIDNGLLQMFFAVWKEVGSLKANVHDGTGWQSETVLEATDAILPKVASAKGNLDSFHVIWKKEHFDENNFYLGGEIYMNRWDLGAMTWEGKRLMSDPAFDVDLAQIAVDAAGAPILSWLEGVNIRILYETSPVQQKTIVAGEFDIFEGWAVAANSSPTLPGIGFCYLRNTGSSKDLLGFLIRP